ncbi:MAG: hypothetical protein FJ035_02055 [Chloroflexi bacterium]|nr:hypothetical protein [Chloroflexota bacterium]
MGWNGLLGAALPLGVAGVAVALRPWAGPPPAGEAELARRWALLTVATLLPTRICTPRTS